MKDRRKKFRGQKIKRKIWGAKKKGEKIYGIKTRVKIWGGGEYIKKKNEVLKVVNLIF